MFDLIAQIAEDKIKEAMEKGELNNLSGQGKPLNLDYWFTIHPDFRAAYTILKNSGYIPEEVELLKEISKLREHLANHPEGAEKKALFKKLEETQIKYALLMERRNQVGIRL